MRLPRTAGDHEPLPCVRPKMARLLAISRNELIELLRPRPSVHVGDVVPAVGTDDPGDHVPSHGGVLLPVVIDGHPMFLPFDASELLKGQGHRGSPAQDEDGRGWSSADDTLKHAERQDSTLHTIVELLEDDVKRKTVAGKATPTLAAQLSAVQARAHALCQDTSASRTAVLEAERHYERFRADGEPAWLSFYTDAELSADLGRALRDSSEPTHATRLMTRTLHSYEPWRVRSRCFVQTDLAAAYLIEGEHEHAAALTRDALSTAGEVSSDRTVSRIRTLQQQIRPLHSVGLAELDEEITDFLRRAHDEEDTPT